MSLSQEEQQALVQFFGTVHAQAKQADQMIVQGAKDLRPVSTDIQNQFQNVLTSQLQTQHQQPVRNEPVVHQGYYEPEVSVAAQQPQEQKQIEEQLDFFNYNAQQSNHDMEKIVKRVTEAASYLYDIKMSLKTIVEILDKHSIQLDTKTNVKAPSKNRVKE